MAAKSRTVAVRLVSMALTGYYKTFLRPRTHRPLSMLKYDPVGTSHKFSLLEGTCGEGSALGRAGEVEVDSRGNIMEEAQKLDPEERKKDRFAWRVHG